MYSSALLAILEYILAIYYVLFGFWGQEILRQFGQNASDVTTIKHYPFLLTSALFLSFLMGRSLKRLGSTVKVEKTVTAVRLFILIIVCGPPLVLYAEYLANNGFTPFQQATLIPDIAIAYYVISALGLGALQSARILDNSTFRQVVIYIIFCSVLYAVYLIGMANSFAFVLYFDTFTYVLLVFIGWFIKIRKIS